MLKYFRQIPAFQHWNNNAPISQRDDWKSYQAFRARVDQLLCFIDILWPEFIERNNFILRRGNVPKDWEQFIRKAQESNWSHLDIEYTINHVHINDLFINDPDLNQIGDDVYGFLADTIANMWRCRLKELYPEKQFVVGVNGEKFDLEVYAYAV
jgi:hypothetical protein